MLEASLAKSVDPDQTAPKGPVRFGSALLASILTLTNSVIKYVQQTTQAGTIFECSSLLALKGYQITDATFCHTVVVVVVVVVGGGGGGSGFNFERENSHEITNLI